MYTNVKGQRAAMRVVPLCMQVGLLSKEELANKVFGGDKVALSEELNAYKEHFRRLCMLRK